MTSAGQLEEYLAGHPGFLGVFSADTLPDPATIRPRPGGYSLIANYSPHQDPGTHWIAILNVKSSTGFLGCQYFDSYGTFPGGDDPELHLPTTFMPFLRACKWSPTSYNPYDLQGYRGPNTDVCGEYSVWAVLHGMPVLRPGKTLFDGAWRPIQPTERNAPSFKVTPVYAAQRVRGIHFDKDERVAAKNDRLIKQLVGIRH